MAFLLEVPGLDPPNQRDRQDTRDTRELASVVLAGLLQGRQHNRAREVTDPVDTSELDANTGSSYLILEANDETDSASVILVKNGAFKWEVGATPEAEGDEPGFHIRTVTGTPGSHTYSDVVVVDHADATSPQVIIYDSNGDPALTVDRDTGNTHIGGSNKELRFYEGANYVGFEAPALTADQIWVLPTQDGNDGDLLCTDGSGDLGWASGAFKVALGFNSPSGTTGTFYPDGYYDFASTDNDFNPIIAWGTANASYAAHVMFVAAAGGGGGDTTVTVTGTSITDAGVRTTSDSEAVVMDDAGAAGAYYETAKKFIGQVTIEKTSGPDLLCNYGWAKYWDNENTDFRVTGFEVTWRGGANDTGADILLRHHKATGWTYNAGSTPTPPTAISSLQGTHVTEYHVRNGENGAFKRTGLDVDIQGSGSEGTIWEVVTSANRAFDQGNILMRVIPAATG